MPLEWHNEMWIRRMESLKRKREELNKLSIEVNRAEQSVRFYFSQIISAQNTGKDGFDEERYLIKKEKP